MAETSLLDHGYVRIVDYMGSDLSVVNAARVSFDKESVELVDKDKKLIRFLATHDHMSPFRHAVVQYEIYAPLMVARQWWKYVVGSDHVMDAWNESSRRYVTEDPVFYSPRWRTAPENRKLGSGEFLQDLEKSSYYDTKMGDIIDSGVAAYEEAMRDGIAPEQARCFLPAYAMYVRWRWTASLQSVAHFVDQRLGHEAQWEIGQYALAVLTMTEPLFPESLKALMDRS